MYRNFLFILAAVALNVMFFSDPSSAQQESLFFQIDYSDEGDVVGVINSNGDPVPETSDITGQGFKLLSAVNVLFEEVTVAGQLQGWCIPCGGWPWCFGVNSMRFYGDQDGIITRIEGNFKGSWIDFWPEPSGELRGDELEGARVQSRKSHTIEIFTDQGGRLNAKIVANVGVVPDAESSIAFEGFVTPIP